jgi:hypothetical protein
MLNQTLDLVSGRITRIYTTDGDKMNDIDDIVNCESRSFVIVSGDDPFYHIKYDVNAIVPSKIKGLGGSTTKNELMGLIRYPKYKPFLPPTMEEREGLESREARRNYVAPKPAKKKKKAAEANGILYIYMS